MNYKINIKCEVKNVDGESSDKIGFLKQELLELNSLYLKQDEKVAYYYEDINTGSILSYNSDILFYAASSIKILIAVMILEMADNNEIDLEEKLLVTMDDLKQDTGIIKHQENDTYYSIRDLIRLSIVESDNTAYIKLVNYVGKDKLEQYGKALGANHTMEGKDLFGLINCDDMVIYWKKVREYILDGKYGNEFKDWLSNPSFSIVENENINDNNYVRKYGSWDIAYHEAGYVEDANPYYMIILTQKLKCDDKEEFVNKTASHLTKIHNIIFKKKSNEEIKKKEVFILLPDRGQKLNSYSSLVLEGKPGKALKFTRKQEEVPDIKSIQDQYHDPIELSQDNKLLYASFSLVDIPQEVKDIMLERLNLLEAHIKKYEIYEERIPFTYITLNDISFGNTVYKFIPLSFNFAEFTRYLGRELNVEYESSKFRFYYGYRQDKLIRSFIGKIDVILSEKQKDLSPQEILERFCKYELKVARVISKTAYSNEKCRWIGFTKEYYSWQRHYQDELYKKRKEIFDRILDYQIHK